MYSNGVHTVVVQNGAENSTRLHRYLGSVRVQGLSSWLWNIVHGREAPSRIQKFLSIYLNIGTEVPSSKAICITRALVDVLDFCVRHGYPLKDVKGRNFDAYLQADAPWQKLANELYFPNVQEYIHDFLCANKRRVLFFDLFPDVHDPLLEVVRNEFVGVQSLIRSDPQTHANPLNVSSTKFKTPDAEARWVAAKINGIKNNRPDARISVISDNYAVLHKIKAELSLFGIPYADRVSLFKTTLGRLIYETVARIGCDDSEGYKPSSQVLSADKLFQQREIDFEETLEFHKKCLSDFFADSAFTLDEQIATDFFEAVKASLVATNPLHNGSPDSAWRVSSQEYQQLIHELLHLHFVSPQVNPGTVLFQSPGATLAPHDVAFLPGMNNGMWMTSLRCPTLMGAIADNFYKEYAAPMEDAILESIVCPKHAQIYITRSEPDVPHRRFLDIPWTYGDSVDATHTRNKPTTTSINVPLNMRPRSFSASNLQLLMDDPYAFYVRRILNLRPNPHDSRQTSVKSIARDVLREYFEANNDASSVSLLEFAEQWIKTNAPASQVLPKLRVLLQQINDDIAAKKAKGAQMISAYKMRMAIKVRGIDYAIYGTADRVDIYNTNDSRSQKSASADDSKIQIHIVSYAPAPSKAAVQTLRHIALPLKALMYVRATEKLGEQSANPPTLEISPLDSPAICIDNSSALMQSIDAAVHQVLERYSSESFTFGHGSNKYSHMSRCQNFHELTPVGG
ncbi:MAG: PD-(D/E)XK nuclease family protein [Holosporales bacterium]|jgi:hypothetical protein|nr:PD-(D/E)XK nuclease family protein [Holosporales bacterium]